METEQVDHNKVVRVNQYMKLIRDLENVKEADKLCGGKNQRYYNAEIHKAQQDMLKMVKSRV